MALRIERDGARVRVAGALGFAEAAAAHARSGDVLGGHEARIELDLSGLERADSATLAVVLAWAAQASRLSRRLVVAAAPADLRALARLSDAESLLGIA